MSKTIASKMEHIKSIFQSAKENASQLNDLNHLIICLEENEKEFLSVAYEGAAMGIALKDFAENNSISNLLSFLELSQKHAPQIYIGLGWAVAQEKNSSLTLTEKLDQSMLFRIWDGCGYFDGIFRQRQTIKGQNRIDYVEPENYNAYDEGIGRSLWYIAKGEVEKVKEMIQLFSVERHSDLWRGIGIACSYVGGFEKQDLIFLRDTAGKHAKQLGVGAIMVAKSRIDADSSTEDVISACSTFCNLKKEDVFSIIVKVEIAEERNFNSWLEKMENMIQNKNQNLI